MIHERLMTTETSVSARHHATVAATKKSKKKKDRVTTELWEAVMHEQWKREQQRRRMVRWRQQKKESVTSMVEERLRLERRLQRHILRARMAADRVTPHSFEETIRLITLQKAALIRENLVLIEAIARHVKLESMLQRDIQEFMPRVDKPCSDSTEELTQQKTKEKALPLDQENGGRYVFFPSAEPSFYFHPFTREEFDSIMNNDDVVNSDRHPCTQSVGELFGWKVDYAPLVRTTEGSVMAHAIFTRRLQCSIDYADKVLPRLDKTLWPKLVTPRSWNRVQTGSYSCQVLQNFHKDAHVMVCNIPGEVDLRYIALAQHTRDFRADGKRVDKYTITIADSEANSRNREAAGKQQDVQWVLEGGTCITITEVDRGIIDVVFDQWAGCLSEMHGRQLYIDWIRFPVGLEQYISPTRLLNA
ncbi:hypothetical protein AM587_10000871 [Phytophthora nicotianae]|uniref:Phospholipase D n=1 Tax=Phytophthora nicotianae TaxID=4792 RepID=A0A0W8DUV0_PHYNI|nr:Phospholipase D [Phytophthora nicotianae]KUG00146.1 hypothetical protein AM587_10000871 [Phytophthora nicotianae]